MNPFILFVVGPTGSGKTKIAVRLAKELNAEIISADSMLVYRKMNIGTAKPTRKDRGGIKHHLMDLVTPRTRFSVEKFRTLAIKKIQEIEKRNRLPIVVGGSGLYVQALIDGLAPNESRAAQIRKKLEVEVKNNGLDVLYERLTLIDPKRASEILPTDERRTIRALEIYEVTGEKPSEWRKKRISLNDLSYSWLMVGLSRDRAELYERTNQRVNQMMESGFLKEVKGLMRSGLSVTAKHAIGYKELIEHIKGKTTLEDAVLMIKQRSRNLAKKQLIWFRKESRIHWIEVKKNIYGEAVKKIIAMVKACG